MAFEAKWMSYGEAAYLLGLPTEATKRLALRHGWPRRPGPGGCMLVALPSAALQDETTECDEDESAAVENGQLLAFLRDHVDRLTEELAEARTEMRGVRYEAESLRVEACRAQVLTTLVEVERARSAELRVERDRLIIEVSERRRPWFAWLAQAAFRQGRLARQLDQPHR